MDSFDDDSLAPSRPSYLGTDIDYQEREAQDADDIKTNLSDRFLLLGGSESSSNQKNDLYGKEPMHVYLRVRPLTTSEMEKNESKDCVSIQDSCSVLVKAPQTSLTGRLSDKARALIAQNFTFTQVFGPETSQTQFFDGTMKQQVMDFMEGQNHLLFTYGVTNAGKTFTFQGTKDDAGILPRTMNMLFNSIQDNMYLNMDLKPHRCREYKRLTKCEVKNEIAIKNMVLRQTKEIDSQSSILSNGSRTSADTTDSIEDEVAGSSQNSLSVISQLDEHMRESEQFKLNVDSSVKFSVWVSFCEIYNENIYDLLDPISCDKFCKRKTLRLAQDIKGFSFVKDLQWIQVSDAKEACRILALGKKFQSIACTKLNSLSSRSHSIFTVRLLRIKDANNPQVIKVSELSLCDLAGSERCTKTQNDGERLKESGNINTSLLILGKCINALKNSQQSKLQQHVPFRESKLTHYLQSFFSGKGKVCMIVNICQTASAYDETLNVLKFSAVAQKVLILDSCKTSDGLSSCQKKSARELSFIINNADKMCRSRKRATMHWESPMETVTEEGDREIEEHFEGDVSVSATDEEDDQEDDQDQADNDIIMKVDEHQKLLDIVEELKTKLVKERKDKFLMEIKIREEVAEEFTQHFMQRENDFRESLEKETELMEDRCDERLEILQDLVRKHSNDQDYETEDVSAIEATSDQVGGGSILLEEFICPMQGDLAEIKKQALEAHLQIASISDAPVNIADLEQKLTQGASELSKTQEQLKMKIKELETEIDKNSKTTIQLGECHMKLSSQKQQIDELMGIIQQKESATERLETLVAQWEAKFEDYDKTMNDIKGEMVKSSSGANKNCDPTERAVPRRKRPPENQNALQDQPPTKKELVENIGINMATDRMQINVDKNTEAVRTLQEEKEALEKGLSDMNKELKDEKAGKEHYRAQVSNLKQTIHSLEDKLAGVDEQAMQMESKNKNMISELQTYKDLNLNLEGTVKILMNEVDQSKLNIANKVVQIRTIQSKIDEFGKMGIKQGAVDLDYLCRSDFMDESNLNQGNRSMTGQKEEIKDPGEDTGFYSAIEGLWKECQRVLKESSKKNQLIQQLEQNLDNLSSEIALLKHEYGLLKLKLSDVSAQDCLLKEKDDLIIQLRGQLSESTNLLETESNRETDLEKEILELKNQVGVGNQQIRELEHTVGSYKEKCEKPSRLEEQNRENVSLIRMLEKRLEEAHMKHVDCEKNFKMVNDEKINVVQKMTDVQNKLTDVENSLRERGKQLEQSEEAEQLKRDLSQRSTEVQMLQLHLQRKGEDYTELKNKLADTKKQIQQVEREVSAMREEKKLLSNKVSEYEKLKKQMSCELEIKQRTIQQLKKEQLDEKIGETMHLYQKSCQDVQAKEKIIEDMRLALTEQEQTQAEQDKALEAKEEEAEKLVEELEEWKQKYRVHEKNSSNEWLKKISRDGEKNNDVETVHVEVSKLQDKLEKFEEKYSSERKKWLEEKTKLLTQAKESETHRNREMRKFAEDRERHTKQQEHLTAQLAEKDNALLKWREERDQLLSALEVQMKSLLSSNMEKEEEIENLKKKSSISQTEGENSSIAELQRQLTSRDDTIEKLQQELAKLQHSKALSARVTTEDQMKERHTGIVDKPGQNNQLLRNEHESETKRVPQHSVGSNSSTEDSRDASDTVLDSSEISTENGKTSRFPKPELEIHFSPATPNKMAVKRHGDASPRTVKISRTTRKRKSHDMEGDIVKSENKKNVITKAFVKTPSSQSSPASSNSGAKKSRTLTLQKQTSTLRTMSTQKKDGTLQKLGDFIQSSPSLLQTKAKKLLETISASKTTDVGAFGKENDSKPKRSRRKLYTTDISAPLDIPAHPIIMDRKEKESDHLIMKRRLRPKTAK
ncbi:kinesin-like protein KIF20B isoform X2 [Ascaphus truei]|uniref:kinesin-like protein KIF20B isoform X2 n=1 Tax=Ascaphus truei TaxID=8439 RepID=UPI003F5ABFBF